MVNALLEGYIIFSVVPNYFLNLLNEDILSVGIRGKSCAWSVVGSDELVKHLIKLILGELDLAVEEVFVLNVEVGKDLGGE